MFPKLQLSILMSLLTLSVFAQSNSIGDQLQNSNKLYAVIAVLCVIFIGIVLFLVSIERKVKQLEKEIK